MGASGRGRFVKGDLHGRTLCRGDPAKVGDGSSRLRRWGGGGVMGRSGRSLLLFSTLAFAAAPARAEQPATTDAIPATNPAGPAEAQLPTAADVAVDVLQPGTSAKSVRETAKASVPLDKLSADHQRLAQGVLGDISLFRRLPT